MSSSPRATFGVHYRVHGVVAGWELGERLMPESALHDEAVALLKALLAAWVARTCADAHVYRNLAIRWNEHEPQIGVDPDVSVVSPAPPGAGELRSLRTWLDGHAAPLLAVEVVSETNPHKDYVIAPDKYAASGARELWVFDPLLAGPTAHGGPHRVQIWQRHDTTGDFTRIHAGDGPAWSPALGAYLIVTAEGRRLRLSDDEHATSLWLTPEEAERAAKEQERTAKEQERTAKEQERAAKEQERTAKEAALGRVAELEALLAATRDSRE
jgi:Uma2 family endonuclease